MVADQAYTWDFTPNIKDPWLGLFPDGYWDLHFYQFGSMSDESELNQFLIKLINKSSIFLVEKWQSPQFFRD